MGESPFVSERTLRNRSIQSSGSIRRPPPPPISAPLRNIANCGDGLYTKSDGFVKGPPPISGIQIYYYDPFNPPSFESGKYSIKSTNQSNSVNISTGSIDVLSPSKDNNIDVKEDLPPPFPTWASQKQNNEIKEKKKLVLNIQKKDKSNAAPVAEASGWQAVMAEMAKKKLKKTDQPTEKDKIIEKNSNSQQKVKKKSKKKGKQEFKDVMDELAYKLAKLRGEITEDNDDDDDEDDDNEEINKKLEKSVSLDSKIDKLIKPDLSILFAKIKLPSSSSANSDTTNVTPVVPPIEPPNTQIGKIAVPKPEKIPLPPVIPVDWPPIPVVYDLPIVVPTNPVEKPDVPKHHKKKARIYDDSSVETELPEGYYMSEPLKGMVEGGCIKKGGLVTQDMFDRLTKKYQQNLVSKNETVATSEETTDHYQNDNCDVEVGRQFPKKLTISDLPLPTYFHATVERMKLCKEKRNREIELGKQVGLRSYLDDKDPAEGGLPSSFVTEKKVEVTKPVEFISHVQKHFDSKSSSFRKTRVEKSSEDSLPLCAIIERVQKPSSAMYSSNGSVVKDFDLSTSFWMSNLRSPVLSKERKNTSILQSAASSPHSRHDEDVVNSFDSNMKGSTSAIQYYAKQNNISKNDYNKSTKSIAPKLATDQLLHRRELIRNEKRKQLKEMEIQKEFKLKYNKEILKQKALGTYNKHDDDGSTSYASSLSNTSSSRYRYHEKLINKYNGHVNIGKIDLRKETQQAFAEYSVKHLNGKNNYFLNSTLSNNKQGRDHFEDDILFRNLNDSYEDYDI